MDAGIKGREFLGGKGETGKGFFGTKPEGVFQFRKPRKKELERAPYPGYGFGIAPRPWIKSMVDAITKEVVKYEEQELPKQIKEKIVADRC